MATVLLGYQLFVAVTANMNRKAMKASPMSPIGLPYDSQISWKIYCKMALPACLDVTASSLSFVGLLVISASVWQMLRGSIIVFSAVLSYFFLERKVYAYHWFGIAICVLGTLFVGYANLMGTKEIAAEPADTQSVAAIQSSYQMVAMALVVFAQLIQAAQIIVEEKILRGVQVPPAVVVGCEGIWGMVLMLFIVFPIMYLLPGSDYGGSQENELDTIVMLKNNPMLLMVIAVYICSCAGYNFSGMCITKVLSGVHRTMLDAWRTMLVWLVDLFVHYFIDSKSAFGEQITPFSSLQLFGFLIIIFGQCVYAGLIHVPGFSYPIEVNVEQMVSPVSDMYLLTPLPSSTSALASGKRKPLLQGSRASP